MLLSKLCIIYPTLKTSLSREGYDATIKSLEEVEMKTFQSCLDLNFQIAAQRRHLLQVWGKSVPFHLSARHIRLSRERMEESCPLYFSCRLWKQSLQNGKYGGISDVEEDLCAVSSLEAIVSFRWGCGLCSHTEKLQTLVWF